MTKRILFYGDSNTWGYISGGERFSAENRFPLRAVSHLPGATALEEGLNGRNCAFSHPYVEAEVLGGATFAPIVTGALPLDAICILLGTNDMLPPICHDAETIAGNLRTMIRQAKEITSAPILLLSPVPIHHAWLTTLEEEMGACNAIRPPILAPHLKRLAEEENISFFDLADIVQEADGGDGVHLSAAAQRKIGDAVGKELAKICSLPYTS